MTSSPTNYPLLILLALISIGIAVYSYMGVRSDEGGEKAMVTKPISSPIEKTSIVQKNADWLSYEHQPFPGYDASTGFTLYYHSSWELIEQKIEEDYYSLSVELKNEETTIFISQGDGGATNCWYPDSPDINEENIEMKFENYQSLDRDDALVWRRGVQPESSPESYDICQQRENGPYFSPLTSIGRIHIDGADESVLTDIDEILNRIKIGAK